MLKGPLAKTYPVSDAAEAVVRGIEQRRRIVACPRWLPVLMAIRPLLPWLTELAIKRDIAEFDRLAEREAAAHGWTRWARVARRSWRSGRVELRLRIERKGRGVPRLARCAVEEPVEQLCCAGRLPE